MVLSLLRLVVFWCSRSHSCMDKTLGLLEMGDQFPLRFFIFHSIFSFKVCIKRNINLLYSTSHIHCVSHSAAVVDDAVDSHQQRSGTPAVLHNGQCWPCSHGCHEYCLILQTSASRLHLCERELGSVI